MNKPSGQGVTYEPVRAPRGNALSCKGWRQEAALRMLMNSLDPEVAECAEDLMVCGGSPKPARDWDSFRAMVASLRELGNNQTLLVQSGTPLGVFSTHSDAPRVMLAGTDWTYIGTQGALSATYEVFSAAARTHFDGTLAGRLAVSGGMGGMGGAQPLAATSNGAAFLGIDVDPERIKRRVKAGYCDVMVSSLDEALRLLKNAVRRREPVSVGLVGNCADVIPELASRGVVPDLLTDQTPADYPLDAPLGGSLDGSLDDPPGGPIGGPLGGYVPQGLTVQQAAELRQRDPRAYRDRALDSIAAHVRGMLQLQKLGSVTFEYGNNIRALARSRGVDDAFHIPGFAPEYFQGLFVQGRAPLLYVALSGDPADIARIDRLALELFSGDEHLQKWMDLAGRLSRFQGLPARVSWLACSGWARFGTAVNDLVARGEVKAPITIACGFFGSGAVAPPAVQDVAISAASPEKAPEMAPDVANDVAHDIGDVASEKMLQGLDVVTDWPALKHLLDPESGSSWVSIERVSIERDRAGHPQRTGWGAVADGTPEMAQRLERFLANEARLCALRYR